uniref:hypothetical protein n=1 Tax=Candidatus Scatousia sp. TaxID=3085663 RepID=UPI00402A5CB8
MGVQGGGFYSAKIREYSKVGSSGMSKSEFREYYMAQSREKSQVDKQTNMAKNMSTLMQTGMMYGMKLDAQSVFQIADKNGDGYVSNKETTAAMGTISRMAQMNALQGSMGQQSGGGSSAMGILNGLTDLAGGVLGAAGGENGGGDGGGSWIKKAGDFIGGLFS